MTIQAIHIIAFAHISISSICSTIGSAAVATGVGNTLGNKGGVGISMKIGKTKFVFLNAHLAAHQNAIKQRNNDYKKIALDIPNLLLKNEFRTNMKLMKKSSKSSVIRNKLNRFSTTASPIRSSGRTSSDFNGFNTGASSIGSNKTVNCTLLNTESQNQIQSGEHSPFTPINSSRLGVAETGSNINLPCNSLKFHECADRVIFMGDLNYRIRGNR